MRRLNEATDIQKKRDSVLQSIQDKDDLVVAWHGTTHFWLVWFCLYGISADVEPPAKYLGRGNMTTGFTKIKDNGLYVSARKLSGFDSHIKLEVAPSELGISFEMKERGYTQETVLKTLQAGDCIIVKKLPAKRIVNIVYMGKVYSRKTFLDTIPDPYEFIDKNYKTQMYDNGNPLRLNADLNSLFMDIKKDFLRGKSPEEELVIIEDFIKHKDYQYSGISLEDSIKIRDWLITKRDKSGSNL